MSNNSTKNNESKNFSTLLEKETNTKSNLTYSNNGAIMYGSTHKPLLDFNFHISEYRSANSNNLKKLTKDWLFVLFGEGIIETKNGLVLFNNRTNSNPKNDIVVNRDSNNGVKTSIDNLTIHETKMSLNSLILKYLFFLRDCRGGLGERKTFRDCMVVTAKVSEVLEKDVFNKFVDSLKYIPEFGRWDDLLEIHYTLTKNFADTVSDFVSKGISIGDTEDIREYKVIKEIERIVREQFTADIQTVKSMENQIAKSPNSLPSISLLAKWLYSINSHSADTKKKAKIWCNVLGLTEPQYRKSLSKLRTYLNIVEKNMSAKEYNKIDYSQVPSKAALIYRNAFMRNDAQRYFYYLDGLKTGETKVNASVTMPYEIVREYRRLGTEEDILDKSRYYSFFESVKGIKGYTGICSNVGNKYTEDTILEEAWKNIPCEDISNTLVIRDGSGSMTANIKNSGCTCLDFADALTLYFAEHNKGEFKDKFITFSSRPDFVDVSDCDTLAKKLTKLSHYDDCSDTNLEAVFRLILDTAKKNNLSQEDLPKNLLVISDMHFNPKDELNYLFNYDETLMKSIEKEYNEAGYELPHIIWWCLTASNTVFPQIDGNCTLISGFSQNNYKMIMSDSIDPWGCLVEVLLDERYSMIG